MIEEILGDGRVDGVRVRDLASGESVDRARCGCVRTRGSRAETHSSRDSSCSTRAARVPMDIWMRTELPGLFAAGDVRAGAVGQAISAAGDGATAAVSAHRYLADRAR